MSCCAGWWLVAGGWLQRGAASAADYAQGTIIEIEEPLPGEDHDPWQSITVLWDDDWSHLNLRSKVGQGGMGCTAEPTGMLVGRQAGMQLGVEGCGDKIPGWLVSIWAAAWMHVHAMYASSLPAEQC